MTTTARVGVDILATDKTRAAFASAERTMSAFGKTAGMLKGALAGAFAGFAAGGFVQSMVRGFVEVNKHTAAVKDSFNTVDRAWQAFALNVGRSGLNDAMIRFNTALAETMVSGRSLATIIGQGLGSAIDGLAQVMTGAAKAVEFLSVNMGKIEGKLQSFFGALPRGQLFDFSDDIRILNALGLDTSMFTAKTGDMQQKLKALPPTFAEAEAAAKKLESQQKKLREAYRSGIDGLQSYANGVLLQSQTFGMGAAAADVYTKKYEFLTKMQQQGVHLTAAQTSEMNRWLDVIGKSGTALEQQRKDFQSVEDTKKSVADLMTNVGQSFTGAFDSAFQSIIDRTSSVKDAFRKMALDILRSVTSLFLNRAMQQLMGGFTPGSNGVAGTGTGLIGSLIGKMFGGFRAGGGTVQAGKAYVVGERRPELFVPNTSGSIVPRVPMGGGNTTVQVIDMRSNAPAVERQQDSNGNVKLFIRDQVNAVLGGGGADGSMGGRFGMKPARIRR